MKKILLLFLLPLLLSCEKGPVQSIFDNTYWAYFYPGTHPLARKIVFQTNKQCIEHILTDTLKTYKQTYLTFLVEGANITFYFNGDLYAKGEMMSYDDNRCPGYMEFVRGEPTPLLLTFYNEGKGYFNLYTDKSLNVSFMLKYNSNETRDTSGNFKKYFPDLYNKD